MITDRPTDIVTYRDACTRLKYYLRTAEVGLGDVKVTHCDIYSGYFIPNAPIINMLMFNAASGFGRWNP